VGRYVMRRLFLSFIMGCVVMIFPIAILKLPTDSGVVGSLKWGVTNLMIPGGFIGLIVSGGKMDDISPWVSGFANFVIYFALAYILLSVWAKFGIKPGRWVAKPPTPAK
jgi:hypothetical protein